MEVNLPPELETFVGQQVQAGSFTSADELLALAVTLLQAEQEATNASIRRGIADYEAGRYQTLAEARAELTARFKA